MDAFPSGIALEHTRVEATVNHPCPALPRFWLANARVAAHAAARGQPILLKVGQAGWKAAAQEREDDAGAHGWALAYWASFLLVAKDPTGAAALGVHPFRRDHETETVEPWLHPALFLDVGAPAETEVLLEGYRVPGHLAFRRAFDRGLALYNPSDLVDVDVPLGGTYLDPFDADCAPRTKLTLGPRAGAVLFAAANAAKKDASARRATPGDALVIAAGGGLLTALGLRGRHHRGAADGATGARGGARKDH